jgi:murein DD-endopeptidase MepM/ murein hydrolase activator NlpD
MKKYIKRTAMLLLLCVTLTSLGTGIASGRTEADINADIRANELRAEQLAEEQKAREVRISAARDNEAELRYYYALIEESIAAVQERMDILHENIRLKQEAIEKKQAEILGLEQDIVDAEFEIIDREYKITLLEEENQENLTKFGQLVRNNYMSGNLGMVDILMDSGNFYDMIVRVDVLQKAAERNTDFMNDLLAAMREQEREIEELEKVKLALDNMRIRAEADKAQLEIDLAALNIAMKALDEEMDAEQEKLRGYAGEIQVLRDAISAMNRQFAATNAELEKLEEDTARLIRERINLDRPNFAGDGFIWPLAERFQRITCSFGWDAHFGRWHRAIDIGNAGINGANIYAIQSGTVIVAIESNSRSGYGSYVVIDHGGGYTSLYAHMIFGSVQVTMGQEVTVGQTLGQVGSTGFSTGPHLHFEIRRNGEAQNPMNYSYTFWA